MLYDPANSPIERRCANCGKLLVTLYYNKEQRVWTGETVRHIDNSTSVYACRDCDEPDLPPRPPRPKKKPLPKKPGAPRVCPARGKAK